MRRLRDAESSSPLMDKVQAMLDATPALPESREQMLRVRRKLDRPRGLAASLQRLPALALAGLVVAFGTSAFAAVRYWVERSDDAPALERPSAHPAVERSLPLPVPTPLPVPVPTPAPDSVEMAEAAPNPASDTTPAVAQRARASGKAWKAQRPARLSARAAATTRVKTTTPVAPAQPAPAKASVAAPAQPQPQAVARAAQPEADVSVVTDNERVHRAVRALRREGNPALAARLLDRVARDKPGPLAEEALSLRIEAALAQRDPRTGALAREYLARYPKGRYLRVARRALQEVE
jgi:hypothetical protein